MSWVCPSCGNSYSCSCNRRTDVNGNTRCVMCVSQYNNTAIKQETEKVKTVFQYGTVKDKIQKSN